MVRDKSRGLFKRHVERLKSSLEAHGHDTICRFLTTHTKLKGRPFSFAGHEYQKRILEDLSRDIVIVKSAQLGISEMSVRLALAKSALINGFSTIYTMPSAMGAQNFMRTRVDPIIQSSAYLSDMIHKTTDNTSIKRFGESYLYMKGAQVDSQAISVPADLLINDEVNNSNQAVLTLFESRLIHSEYGLTVKLSTPTIPNYGIDAAYKQSRRYVNMCKCCHCNEWFYPEYHDHAVIPGYKGSIGDVSKGQFADPDFRWQESFIACPKCGLRADLQPEFREWVCENPGDGFVAAGYRVSPFDCPSTVSVGDIVKSSTTYERRQDFYNQRLGISLEDAESTFLEEELRGALISEYAGGCYNFVAGLDMGKTCWLTVAGVKPDQSLVIVHTEGIPLFRVAERMQEITRQFKLRMTVVDSLPYTETVYRMQQDNQNLFAAIYSNSKNIELFKIRDKEEDAERGVNDLRQVNIAKHRMFDHIMLEVRSGRVKKVSDGNDGAWIEHLQDQKRVKEFILEELQFVWTKTAGVDHLHHSLLYAFVASRLTGMITRGGVPLPCLVNPFRLKN